MTKNTHPSGDKGSSSYPPLEIGPIEAIFNYAALVLVIAIMLGVIIGVAGSLIYFTAWLIRTVC